MLEKFIEIDVCIIFELTEVVKIIKIAEWYLAPSQTSLMELFCKNSQQF